MAVDSPWVKVGLPRMILTQKEVKKNAKDMHICWAFQVFFISFWLCGGKHVCLLSTNRLIFKQEFLFKKEAKNRTKSTLPHWMWILASFWVNHIRKTKGCKMIDFNMQMTQPSLNRWHCFSQSSLYICTLREVPWQQSWKTVEDHRFRISPLLMHRRTNYEPWH